MWQIVFAVLVSGNVSLFSTNESYVDEAACRAAIPQRAANVERAMTDAGVPGKIVLTDCKVLGTHA